jgi:HEAT repeat protein
MKSSKLNLTLVASLALAVAVQTFGNAAESAPDVSKQVAVLTSVGSEKEKADACRMLAHTGTKEAIPALAALLTDEKLSHMARYALEPMPSTDVDKVLREALDKTQGRVKAGIIGSLGVRRDTKAVNALAALLRSGDPEVAPAAARALGSIGNSAAVKALQKAAPGASGVNQLAICEGLLRAAEVALKEGKQRQAAGIYDQLRELQSPAHQVRAAAVRGAILARQNKGIPILVETLRGNDFGLVLAAARAAQEMTGSEVTAALTKELPGLPAPKQIVVIQTLGRRHDLKGLPALMAAAKNSDKSVRMAAIAALPQIGDPSAAPLLLSAMRESDPEIAQAAQENLAALPGREVDKAVLDMLNASDARSRITGMDLAARRRMVTAVPELFKAASGSDQQVRVAAFKRLGELAGPSHIPTFLELMGSAKSQEDMDAIEQALGSVCAKSPNPADSVGMLSGRLGQAQPAQKCALLRVLTGAGGTEALKVVRASLKDSNAEVRAAALRSLTSWNNADAAPDLLELARTAENPTDKMVSLRGYLDMAKRGELNEEQRLTMCREAGALVQKPEEKRLLLAALGDISSADSVALIQPYLEDQATKEEASTAIVGISERLLRRNNSATFAPKLVEPLEKVVGATGNSDLAARAKKLFEQAKSKAGNK